MLASTFVSAVNLSVLSFLLLLLFLWLVTMLAVDSISHGVIFPNCFDYLCIFYCRCSVAVARMILGALGSVFFFLSNLQNLIYGLAC
jgi:hypothetical protein